jgi:hypothetical protein
MEKEFELCGKCGGIVWGFAVPDEDVEKYGLCRCGGATA